jgi:stress-induced morphogen
MVKVLGKADPAVDQLAIALATYEKSNPGAECWVSRYNPASIRIKVVDPAFHGWSKGKRHDHAYSWLNGLAEDVLAQISILLCLEPGEHTLMDLEFHDPVRSWL